MMTITQQKKYRATLTWIGFVTLYILAPIALVTGVYLLDGRLSTTTYDRDQFLQTAHARP
jgi:hypothetical protein